MMGKRASITLIGMPGAGKSTVGVVLAKMTNMQFLDTDLLIQGSLNRTLQSLLDEHGTSAFMEIENDALSKISSANTIIATGGSAIYSEDGMRNLSTLGPVIYLRGSIDEISRRVGDFDERGVVFAGEVPRDLCALFEQRRPLYERFADHAIDIDGKSVMEVAREIADMIDGS